MLHPPHVEATSSSVSHPPTAHGTTVLASPTVAPRTFYRRKLPDLCIDFASAEGKLIFKEALHEGFMEGYFSLAAQFHTQRFSSNFTLLFFL